MTTNIIDATEASIVLRCATADPDMLQLLPLVDQYINYGTGRDWTADYPIDDTAKAAARMLITLWHENPSMITNGMTTLNWGLNAVMAQLEAKALEIAAT